MRRVCIWICIAAFVLAQMDHLEPQRLNSLQDLTDTVIVQDETQTPEWQTVASGSTNVGCDGKEANCEAQRAAPNGGSARDFTAETQKATQQTGVDMVAYTDVIHRFEMRTNDWCCAVMGKALFTVSGDRDIMNYMFYFLSQVFDYHGQNYGGRIVLDFHKAHDKSEPFNCDANPLGEESGFAAPIDALLGLKEMLSSWLTKNEVEPRPIISGFMPQARQLYSKLVRSRMLFATRDVPVHFAHSDAAIAAVLPMIESDDKLEYCMAGGEFDTLGKNASLKIRAQIDTMLHSCVDNGRIATNPVEYGEVLLEAGKDYEARELFNLAVQRGSICNAWQRPSAHHRKDIPAAAIWPNYKLPGVIKAFQQLLPTVQKAASAGTLSMLPDRGEWTRLALYSRMGTNETLCAMIGDTGCTKVLQAAASIIEANDGYDFACNGSLTIEMWKFAPSTTVPRAVGATNIVLQAVVPVMGDSLTVQVGEDTAQLITGATDPVILDDSFEHLFKTGSQGTIALHAQVCHPSLHEKALDTPSTECAQFEDDE